MSLMRVCLYDSGRVLLGVVCTRRSKSNTKITTHGVAAMEDVGFARLTATEWKATVAEIPPRQLISSSTNMSSR